MEGRHQLKHCRRTENMIPANAPCLSYTKNACHPVNQRERRQIRVRAYYARSPPYNANIASPPSAATVPGTSNPLAAPAELVCAEELEEVWDTVAPWALVPVAFAPVDPPVALALPVDALHMPAKSGSGALYVSPWSARACWHIFVDAW